MATDRRGPQGPLPDGRDGEEVPFRIHTCGRIGMQASPPRARLSGWLRRGPA
jgi:hypothetical protein